MAEGPAKKPKSGWISVLVDYGPLLVFFLAIGRVGAVGQEEHQQRTVVDEDVEPAGPRLVRLSLGHHATPAITRAGR